MLNIPPSSGTNMTKYERLQTQPYDIQLIRRRCYGPRRCFERQRKPKMPEVQKSRMSLRSSGLRLLCFMKMRLSWNELYFVLIPITVALSPRSPVTVAIV
jgi:hypothetical protein